MKNMKPGKHCKNTKNQDEWCMLLYLYTLQKGALGAQGALDAFFCIYFIINKQNSK